MTQARGRDTQSIRRAYEWLLFGKGRWEVGVLSVIGALPVLLSPLDDTFYDIIIKNPRLKPASCPTSPDGLHFFGLESKVNWWIFVLFLPLALVFLRMVIRAIIANDHGDLPPLSMLVDKSERISTGARVRRFLLSGWIPASVALLVAAIAWFDLGNVVPAYLYRVCPSERDWTVFVLLPNRGISPWANGLHVAVAYLIQYATGFLALLAFGIFLVHNVYYLHLIYQRRRGVNPAKLIVLKIDDPVCCFGQKALRPAFRMQVVYVVVTGIAVAFSRYQNVAASAMRDTWGKIIDTLSDGHGFSAFVKVYRILDASIVPSQLFPDAGQWTLAILFVAVFGVVGLPSLVKFLPFRRKGMLSEGDIGMYLAEFIPPGKGVDPTEMNHDDLHALAGQFAENSFWPAGDNVARRLFAFAFAVLIFILLPVPLEPFSLVFLYAIAVAFMAVALTAATFLIYEYVLAYIGQPLVTPTKKDH